MDDKNLQDAFQRDSDEIILIQKNLIEPLRQQTLQLKQPSSMIFGNDIFSGGQTEELSPTKPYRKKRFRILLGILVLCTAIGGYSALQVFPLPQPLERNTDASPYLDILGEQGVKEWEKKSVTPGAAQIQLNLRIPVDENGEATIKLINPPYSDYACIVTLKMRDSEEVVFQSKLLYPGTVVNTFWLEQHLEQGEYPAIAEYTFFDGRNTEQGNHTIEVNIVKG